MNFSNPDGVYDQVSGCNHFWTSTMFKNDMRNKRKHQTLLMEEGHRDDDGIGTHRIILARRDDGVYFIESQSIDRTCGFSMKDIDNTLLDKANRKYLSAVVVWQGEYGNKDMEKCPIHLICARIPSALADGS